MTVGEEGAEKGERKGRGEGVKREGYDEVRQVKLCKNRVKQKGKTLRR